MLIANTGEDFIVSFSELSRNLFARAEAMELGTGGGIMDIIMNGLTDLSYLLMSFLHTIIFELFLLFILLCLIVIYAVSMAQALWAQLALGVLLILGPFFIPFILVEPLAFPVLGMVQEHVHLHPLWRDCGGPHAGVPRSQYRLDGRHCQRSPTEYEFPVA